MDKKSNKEFIVKKESELERVASAIIEEIKETPVVVIFGEMGVGKTTFIKEICSHLGVKESVNSPSYSIINHYLNNQQQSIYHFDLYRLKNSEEFFDIGGEDYLYSGDICLIEWPDIIRDILPDNILKVTITSDIDQTRKIVFSK
ncbi:tRNA (adenosine(37)-N6)-threonylcarbamoyltransferase complex ATPase subunit type 1 TsaE [Marinilabiliaceae bacterium ANBcel2]|nr:tRNA (adenosine(37)-N6)-threonylcarbamoyltransferase complex ATPase subunit type 1 TsaE [Marinilabiliaceae bacterium ANBcel2]